NLATGPLLVLDRGAVKAEMLFSFDLQCVRVGAEIDRITAATLLLAAYGAIAPLIRHRRVAFDFKTDRTATARPLQKHGHDHSLKPVQRRCRVMVSTMPKRARRCIIAGWTTTTCVKFSTASAMSASASSSAARASITTA